MSQRFTHSAIALSALCLLPILSQADPGSYHGLPLANPHLAILPADSQPNYDHWLQKSASSPAFKTSRSLAPKTLTHTQVEQAVNEQESNSLFGENDTKAMAQTLSLDYNQLTGIYGTLAIQPTPQVFSDSHSQSLEVNDTSLSASVIDFSQANSKHIIQGSLNDGQQSPAGRDFDILKLNNLNPHWPLYIEYDAPEFSDAEISFSDEQLEQFVHYIPEFYSVLPFYNHFESSLYVAVGASELDDKDAFENTSSRSGFSNLNDYSLSFYQPEVDLDYFQITLNEGDLLSVTSHSSNVLLQIESPLERFVAGLSPIGFIYPANSPAIKTGVSNIAYTATESGTHTILVRAGDIIRHSTDYEVLIQRTQSSAQEQDEPQVVFLDFNGATLNGLPFNGINENITLSGLSHYLEDFELQSQHEAELIEEIVKVFTLHFETLINGYSGNANLQLTILNSAQHPDPFGEKNVSRIIIGGGIEELKLATIGIAQSLDPGNFNKEETGIVLLDLLSSQDNQANSLNFLSRDASVSKLSLVAHAVGTIAAHELGHILSGFHTDNSNSTYNIMDAGGNSNNRLGIGEDGIFGTHDDGLVSFQQDKYDPNLNYFGQQDTPNQIAQGLRTSSASDSSGSSSSFLGLGSTQVWLLGFTCLMVLRRKKK
jgi:hypothetical protein